ncbi:MAG: CpXC domain-containing protein [Bacteroidales bacterium]|nr:CpXC domain-containing protein [Bacteroidales bacterium]
MERTFHCFQCGQPHAVETWPSINVAQDPDLKGRVRDGSLFVWECPHCGARNLAKYQTLYHDPAERLMVWLLPDGQEPPAAVAEAVQELDGYTLRRVRDVGALVEKVLIHDAGLEDTILEMCKHVTRMELADQHPNPALLDVPMRFYRLEGADHEITLSFPLDGQMQVVNIGFNVYEDARGILSRNPSVQPAPGFAEIDASWLRRYFR